MVRLQSAASNIESALNRLKVNSVHRNIIIFKATYQLFFLLIVQLYMLMPVYDLVQQLQSQDFHVPHTKRQPIDDVDKGRQEGIFVHHRVLVCAFFFPPN